MKIHYNHLIQYILENPTIGQISHSLFQLGHEHEIESNIFDIEFTPNRGDCLSLSGLLRDLAVFYSINFNQKIYAKKLNKLNIAFENKLENTCPQISFLKLEIEKIPELYKNSLDDYFSDFNLSKNNFFTDLSNYLSYETGQPTHCYDADKINEKLIFHQIEKQEEFETLIDKKITLKGKNAVFSLNNEVINLAGIMGGKSTACSAHTKTVLVECAYFKPDAIIGKSVKYDIKSDASYKFERGVDYGSQDKTLRRFIQVVSEHTNIKEMSIVSYNYIENQTIKIPINVNKINQIIGINISEDEYINYLTRLEFIIEEGYVNVPSFRSDIKTQNDLAEEVARVIGYNNISRAEINIPKSDNRNYKDIENKLRYFLLDHGFYEVINSPFVGITAKEAIKVDNPLDSNRAFLRKNLTDSLVENLVFNERRQKDSVKLFEISDIYSSKNGIHKNRMLSIVASGRVGLNYQDFSKKIDTKYLTEMFQEILPNEFFDFQILSRDSLDTKIKSEIITLEVNIERFSADILSYREASKSPESFAQFNPISDLPISTKDLSYSIKDFSKIRELENLFLSYQSDIVKNIFIFDYFYNEKSQEVKIGFRIVFQSKETTLTAAQIELAYNDLIDQSLKIDGISIPGIWSDILWA